MKLLVTGAGGQLGRMLVPLARERGHTVVPTYHEHVPPGEEEGRVLDLQRLDTIQNLLLDVDPDAVVHAAALTDVDACEAHPEKARLVNARATGELAGATREASARLVVVSTDYVFDGRKGNYDEGDEPHPVNVYGETKLEGERLAQAHHPGALVARTCVVYGPHKPNFVTWLRDELAGGREVRIVEDQRISPTYTGDLAAQLLALLDHDAEPGTYHTAGATACTRLEMAHAIADVFDLDASLITPITMADLDWDATRPHDTSLDVSKMQTIHQPLTLEESLERLREDLA